MVEPEAGDTAARRRLTGTPLAAVLLVSGAVLTAVSAALVWGRADYQDSLRGLVSTSASGSDMRPELTPIALAALAGLGATLATRGVARRMVGVGIALAGSAVTVRAIVALFDPTLDTLRNLSRAATAIGPPQTPIWPPLLATLGGFLLLTAGLVISVGKSGKGLSKRFERTAPRRAPSVEPQFAAEAAATDLWNSLNADSDPTADPDPVAKPAPDQR